MRKNKPLDDSKENRKEEEEKREKVPATDEKKKKRKIGFLGLPMQKYLARGLAKGVVRRVMLLKIAGIVMAVSATGLAVTYAVASALDENERFTITIDYEDYQKKGISLSTNPNDQTSYRDIIYAQRVDALTNISYEKAIAPILDEIKQTDGSYNTVNSNYIAYTFYLKNSGSVPVTYQEDLKILEVTKNFDTAIRTLLIRNDVTTMYAKLGADSNPEPVDYRCGGDACELTTPFYDSTTVLSNEYRQFQVGEVVKYTIVVWLEGNDPQCLDPLKGGGIKLAFDFKIID